MTYPINISRVRHFKSLAHLDAKQAARAAEMEAEFVAKQHCIVPGCFNWRVTELCAKHQEEARG